jgi:hypothetical protein
MKTGYTICMNTFRNKKELKLIPKFEKMERISARSSCMIEQNTIHLFD